jgi:hypothetical protein
MDLGFLDVFPGIGFQNKVCFAGPLSGFYRIWIGFLEQSGFVQISDRIWTLQSRDKAKLASHDRFGILRIRTDLDGQVKDTINMASRDRIRFFR